MAAILHMTYSNAFSWMKIVAFFIQISMKFGDKPLSEPKVAWFNYAYVSLGLNELNENVYIKLWELTHCGLVTSYGDRDLGQHWLR